MRTLSIDIETYSSVDLIKCGVYKYVDAHDFEILLFAYAFDDETIRCIDLAQGERIPAIVAMALQDPTITKTAFNANFERTCIAKYLNKEMNPQQWRCTSVHALTLGLPGNLDGVAKTMNLEVQKDAAGKALIKYFSVPCKATKVNGGRTRNLPEHAPEKWGQFKAYCIQDVEVERTIKKKLQKFEISDFENKLWALDQQVNDRGVRLEPSLFQNAIECDAQYTKKLMDEAAKLTGLENPNSLAQLKGWLSENGLEADSLTKDTVPVLIAQAQTETVKRVLRIRQELGKTSVSKFQAMERGICSDNRVRGLLQFYGANRTGRWAGRLVQVQNLPRIELYDLDVARELLISGDYEMMDVLFGKVPFVLSQLIRTAFIPAEGHRFIVSDFSAIEARVIAWLAYEQWRIDVFKGDGKIYESSASQMFGVPIELIKKGNPEYELRALGKVAELACIARGQLVLTDKGLVPIEKVTKRHKVWDGIEFVNHGGVIYRGVKEVISYEGLTATPDHIVWVEGKQEPIRFDESSASSAHLVRSGNGGNPIRLGKHYRFGKALEKRLAGSKGSYQMRRMRSGSMDASLQFKIGKIKRMSKVLPAKENSKMVGQKIHGGKTEMYKSEGCGLSKLRRTWNSLLFRFSSRSWVMDDRKLRIAGQGHGNRPDRYKRELRAGESSMGNPSGELRQSAPVYDILNCGPRNRFTVSDCLVHNCGYQGGGGALAQMDKKGEIDPEDYPDIIKRWRAASPNIVKFWYDVERAAIKAVKEKTIVQIQHGLKFFYESGVLFIQLPSGRRLAYPKPQLKNDERFDKIALSYEGSKDQGGWGRIPTYGGKLVENIVQATARDCLAESMIRLDEAGYEIVFHVHDEVIIEAPIGKGSLKDVEEIMGQPISWAKGLPLNADGFETYYYKKD